MNTSSLRVLIDQAVEQRDSAAAVLADLNDAHARARAQLDALETYRAEYAGRLAQAMARGVYTHRLDNDQRFLAALDTAIRQQTEQVATSQRRVDNGKAHWQSRERRVQSFDALAERGQREAALREARAEQRLNDEAAGRMMRPAHG